MGRGVAADQVLKSHICVCCRKEERLNPFKQFSGCHAVRYCSLRCQKSHWKEHKPLCSAIKFLCAQNKKDDVTDSGTYVSHLTPRQHATVTKLVGRRCTVRCLLNSVDSEALWNTGAHVSILSKDCIAKNLSSTKSRSLKELLEHKGRLDLRVANGTEIPYEGWI